VSDDFSNEVFLKKTGKQTDKNTIFSKKSAITINFVGYRVGNECKIKIDGYGKFIDSTQKQ
jgi:hypothetical protein